MLAFIMRTKLFRRCAGLAVGEYEDGISHCSLRRIRDRQQVEDDFWRLYLDSGDVSEILELDLV